MKIKREYVILGALIIALTVYLIYDKRDRSFYDLPEIPGIVREDITKIEISQKDNRVTLHKKDASWYVSPGDYPADKDKVNGILDVIEKLSLTALVSESRNYEIYDLGDDKKITVKAWASDGSLKREFDIGKTAESYRHTHVKLPQNHRVYHANTNFRPKFDQTMEDLRDKTVLSFDKKEIREVICVHQGKTYTFIKEEPQTADAADTASDSKKPAAPSKPVWKYKGKGSVDQQRLESLLDVVSKLKCETYIYDRQKEDFNYPVFTLTFKGNQNHVLKIFSKKDKNDKRRPCISSGSDQPFEIPDYQATHFMESLLKE